VMQSISRLCDLRVTLEHARRGGNAAGEDECRVGPRRPGTCTAQKSEFPIFPAIC
jgi:hypothetical protein